MKIVQVGCSGHFSKALAAIASRDDLCLAGFCKGCEDEDSSWFISRYKDKYGFAVYDDPEEMFDRLKPDIAIVNSYFYINSRISTSALERGISVYSEKPVATTLDELYTLRNVYEKSNAHFASMLESRCNPAFYSACCLIRDGKVGEILMVTAQKSYKLGNRPEFYKHRETFGGVIPWVGIHSIDWIRWLSGQEIEPVYAFHDKRHNRNHGDLETAALCVFKLENGGVASNNIDYLRPDGAATHGDDRVRVAGSKGVVEVIGGKARFIDSEGSWEIPLENERNPFELFVNQVSGGPACHISAEDSFRTTEVALKARDMADTCF
jgi:predicted dehydrogenase